jgi:hypothetical protein
LATPLIEMVGNETRSVMSHKPSGHQHESFCVKLWFGASFVVWPCIAEWGWSRQRVIGLVRRRAGLPMMSGEISVRLHAA